MVIGASRVGMEKPGTWPGLIGWAVRYCFEAA